MGHDGMSHINVIDTGTVVREEYTTHGLHLNSRDRMRLKFILLRKVYVLGMCQIGTVVFLLLPMLKPLLF
jgi:hypothetical protein